MLHELRFPGLERSKDLEVIRAALKLTAVLRVEILQTLSYERLRVLDHALVRLLAE